MTFLIPKLLERFFSKKQRDLLIGPGVFEALENEMYMRDLERDIPNSIFMKLDKDASVRTIKINMIKELSECTGANTLTIEPNTLVDIIRKGNWHV